MNKPSVIVFDLGKVLVDFDYSIAARRIVARCARPPGAVKFFAEHADLLNRYELGFITTKQFYDGICDDAGFSGSQDEFSEYFADIFTEIPAMTEFHATLRQKGFPTWIFSNTNELAVRHIARRFPFFANFDGYVYSYEHGSMKPDTKLYEVVEKQTGRKGNEILYLDDRSENVEAGAARGWHAVFHESPEKTRSLVQQAIDF